MFNFITNETIYKIIIYFYISIVVISMSILKLFYIHNIEKQINFNFNIKHVLFLSKTKIQLYFYPKQNVHLFLTYNKNIFSF